MQMIISALGIVVGFILLLLYFINKSCRKHIIAVVSILSFVIGSAALIPWQSLTAETTQNNSEGTSAEEDTEDTQASFVWLSDLSPADNEDTPGFVSYDTVTDNLSNSYKNGLGGSESYSENVEAYSLGGQFQSFRGKVVLNYDCRATNTDNTYVKIYGDDEPIWISPLITAGQDPVEFELNEEISDVDVLKISIYGSEEIRLVDCALYVSADTPTETTCTPYNPQWGNMVSLKDMNTYNASDSSGNGFERVDSFTDNLGTQYSNAIIGTSSYSDNWETYYINQAFAEFKGYVALDYNNRSTTDEFSVKIYGDDTLLFTSNVFTAGTEPQPFSISVSNFSKIKVVLPGNSIALVDAMFYQQPSDTVISTGVPQDSSAGKDKVPLIMLDYVASSSSDGGFKTYGIVKDNLGNVYADGIGGKSGYDENWETYKLAKHYKCIEGKIVVNYDSRSNQTDDVYVKLYDGDTIIYTSPLITAGVEPIDFSVDISNVDTLKISFMGTNIVRLVDVYLYK